MDRPAGPASGDRPSLSSWKEIAAQLDVSVKTAQRYENELGLPIKRLGGRVSITVPDLLAWQARNAKPIPWWANVRKLQIGLGLSAGLVVLAVIGIAVYYFFQKTGPPASVHTEGSLLTVRDAKGRPVWQHLFDVPALGPGEHPFLRHRFSDIDNDGQLETVGVWQHALRDTTGWGVHCFSSDGKLRWLLHLDDRVRTAAGKEFGPPYVVRSFTLFASPENDGTQWVAAVFVHVNDVFSTLIVTDSLGKRRGQYWHSGHLNTVQMFDADGDGKKEVVAGGVRHGVEQAVIVAFDPGRVSAANAMPKGHPQAILDMGLSSEKSTGFFARSLLSKEVGPFNFISDLHLVNGILRAHVYESLQAPEGYLLNDFEPGLRIREITMSATFLGAHQQLRKSKKLAELIPEKELARLRGEFRLEPPR